MPQPIDPIVHGTDARELGDRVSRHFTVKGLTDGRGWWADDVEGEVARYEYAARHVFEPARVILGVPMDEVSGARPARFNKGKPSSMHMPPVQRDSSPLRFMHLPTALRGAALDFTPIGMPCDEAFWRLDAAQRDGRLPAAGLFWYGPDRKHPGPVTGRFVHIDFRPGGLARVWAQIPPRSHS